MGTECYAMVRGSGIRVTELDKRGGFDPVYASMRQANHTSVTKVGLDPLIEAGGNEVLRNDEEENRLHFVTNDSTIRWMANIEFNKVCPDVLELVAGVPLVQNAAGDYVGFDGNTRMPAVPFALEVWTKLAGNLCDDSGFRKWGYTLFPYLKGGRISGFVFANGLVSFNLVGAQTRRGNRWGYGPYEELLDFPVSRNTNWRQIISTAYPPWVPVPPPIPGSDIDGGSASITSGDVVDGQFVVTSGDTIDGGTAA